MTRKIIAAVSNINGGKDFLMNNLQKKLVWSGNYTMRTVRCRFADSLNQALCAILGLEDCRELQDRHLKELKRFIFGKNHTGIEHKWSSRDLQKEIGRLLREYLGEDVFVNALSNRYSSPKAILLISDLRYQNELDWVKRQGGKIVYIHNEAAAQAQKAREMVTWDCGKRVHYPPESEVLQWDFYDKVETPDYWLDNNDFTATQPFDDFVKFVLEYLEEG